jgi:hypothetical protein
MITPAVVVMDPIKGAQAAVLFALRLVGSYISTRSSSEGNERNK